MGRHFLGQVLAMSITGSFGTSSAQRLENVGRALRELQYPFPGSAPLTLDVSNATFGSVNEGSLSSTLSLLVAFEGELYERAQLAFELGVTPDLQNAELAAAAFRRWGPTFPDHLYGEFCFALWEPDSTTLWLGCDTMARRALFYTRCEGGFCFGTEAKSLLNWRGVESGIDDEAIARLIALEPAQNRTIYRNILLATGGSVTRLRAGEAPGVSEYWFPLAQPPLHARRTEEYAEELHAAMSAAVERRLPANGLVACQLSSGFDSSAITALAAEALQRQNRSLVAYTSVPTQHSDASQIISGRFANEWPLAAETAAMYANVEHVAVHNDSEDWWSAIDFFNENLGAPITFIRNLRWYVAILKAAQERGAVSMFEGSTGNLTSSYSGGFGLFDLRRRGSWTELARAIRMRRQSGASWKSLAMATWLPTPGQMAILHKLRRRRIPRLLEVSMLRADFVESVGLSRNIHAQFGKVREGDRNGGPAWRRSSLRYAEGGAMYTLHRRGAGLRREDPTADRRLIELVLRIPDEAFVPEGKPRELYRKAFRRNLPPALLAEKKRGLQSSDFLSLFEPWIPELHQELDLQEASPSVQRVLDLPRMRQGLRDWEKWKHGPRGAADSYFNYTFGSAIVLGRFLRKEAS